MSKEFALKNDRIRSTFFHIEFYHLSIKILGRNKSKMFFIEFLSKFLIEIDNEIFYDKIVYDYSYLAGGNSIKRYDSF